MSFSSLWYCVFKIYQKVDIYQRVATLYFGPMTYTQQAFKNVFSSVMTQLIIQEDF